MKTANNNKRGIIVGIFIFLGILIFTVAILTLGGQQKTFQKSLMVKAFFSDVEGLQKGNNVWFSGVKIGTVKNISFKGNSQVEVDISIQESSKEYIRRDAKAKISSDGLIGNKIVVLYGGSIANPPIESGDVLVVDKASTTDEMFGMLQNNNKNLLDITGDFKLISKRLSNGEGTVGKLLTDEALLNDMQKVMATLQRAAINTERLTSTVTAYTGKLNNRGTLANELVSDTILYARLKETSKEIETLSQTAKAAVNDLKNATENVNAGLNNKNTPAGMLLKDEGVANDLKSTLHYLNSSTQKLDENLEALQHNFLLRGFFKKKAKREQKEAMQAVDSSQ